MLFRSLLLARLFFNLGLPEAPARDLAVAVRASADKLPFHSLEELLAVPGMTPEIYYGGFRSGARRPGLDEVLTVRTRRAAVDVNYAPAEVLASLPGMDLPAATAVVAARARRPFRNIEELAGVAAVLRSPEALPFVTLGGTPGVAGLPLTLRAYGRAAGAGLERAVTALVELDPKEPAKMRVLEWKE